MSDLRRQRNENVRKIDRHDCTTGVFRKREAASSQKHQIELQITVNPDMIPGPQRACCYGNVIIVATALIRGSLLSYHEAQAATLCFCTHNTTACQHGSRTLPTRCIYKCFTLKRQDYLISVCCFCYS